MAEKTVAPHEPETVQEAGREETRNREQFFAPPVDIFESADGLSVLADLPGVNKDGLDLQVKDDLLTISARAGHSTPGEPVYREFELVNFFRQFQLADTVDTNRIQAEFRNGVLALNLPKAEAAKPRRIEVQVG